MSSQFDYEPPTARQPRRRRESRFTTVAYEFGAWAIFTAVVLFVIFKWIGAL